MLNSKKMRHFISSILLLSGLVPLLTYSQTVAVELEKMNILYVGVDNPIRIAVENYPCDKIIVKPTYGTINVTSDNCHYSYKIDSCDINREIIFIGVKVEKTIKWLDTIEYKVKKIPDPRILIGAHFTGSVKKDVFINSTILAHLDLMDSDNAASVINYSYEIYRRDSTICRETNIQGNIFTEKLKSEIAKSQKGDRYVFFDVIATMAFDKCPRQLQSTEYIIE